MSTSAALSRALTFTAALLLGTALGCDGSSQPPNGKPLPAGQGSGSSKPIGGGDEAGGGEAPAGTKTPMIAAEHPLYGRMEGEGLNNKCAADSECFKGGCGAEICSADKGANSTCEVLDVSIPASAGCGCVSGQCIWYTTDGATLPASQAGDSGDEPPKDPPSDPAPVACGEKTCAAGETCIEYFGIAGPNGPRFESCGIPCGPKRTCPEGKSCVTVADGPGDVCQ